MKKRQLIMTEAFSKERFACHAILATEAQANEDYPSMLKHYQQALAFSTNAEEKRGIALELAAWGNTQKDIVVASEAYRMAIGHLDEGRDKNQLVALYQALGHDAIIHDEKDQAIALFVKALKLVPNDVAILKQLAILYEAKDFKLAEEIYNQLIQVDSKNKDEYHEALAALHIKKKEQEQALNEYLKILDGTPGNQKAQAAATIISLAKNLYHVNPNNPLVLEAFNRVVPYLDRLEQFKYKQDLLTVYIALAQAAKAKNTPQLNAKADEYYLKAIQIDPVFADWKPSWLFELGNLYGAQGQVENAVRMYRMAQRNLQVESDNSLNMAAFNTSVASAEIAVGDIYYARGINNTKIVNETLVKLADHVEKSPEIANALGATIGWVIGGLPLIGRLASDTHQLQSLLQRTKKSLTPAELEETGLALCTLVEKAYDGQKNHLAPGKMPNDLKALIQSTRQKISNMRDYYVKLQLNTEELVAAAKSSDYNKLFKQWTATPPLKDLKQAPAIEKKATDALHLIKQASQAKGSPQVTPALRENMKALETLPHPAGMESSSHFPLSKRE